VVVLRRLGQEPELLHIQKLGLTFAAPAYDWATRFGRPSARHQTEVADLSVGLRQRRHQSRRPGPAAITRAAGHIEDALVIAAHTLFEPRKKNDKPEAELRA
jgi:hypothetical protein